MSFSVDQGYALITPMNKKANVVNSWITKPVLDNESNIYFVALYGKSHDSGLYKFANEAMVRKLQKLRNDAVSRAMSSQASSSAPASLLDEDDARVVKFAKRDVADEIPSTVQVRVNAGGNTHLVRLLTSSRGRSVPWVEMTPEAMALLAMAPDDPDDDDWSPCMDAFPKVSWLTARHALKVSYWNSDKQKMDWHQKKVAIPSPYCKETVQQSVDKIAPYLQQLADDNPSPTVASSSKA